MVDVQNNTMIVYYVTANHVYTCLYWPIRHFFYLYHMDTLSFLFFSSQFSLLHLRPINSRGSKRRISSIGSLKRSCFMRDVSQNFPFYYYYSTLSVIFIRSRSVVFFFFLLVFLIWLGLVPREWKNIEKN